ncbi:MAG: histidine--tRNA ligase [Gammaproteobacteria bacterium]
MSEKFQAIRGFNDILPKETLIWQQVEDALRDIFDRYGYGEIRLPLLERTELFQRSIGEVTDIVEKEMYTFADRNNESVTLRPEATAGCIRAGIANGMFHNATQRLWYSGPMFRYERPQKGRYRQFYQVGCEAVGFEGPDIDAEMIFLATRLWETLGITDIRLEINSLGTSDARKAYRSVLIDYFNQHKSDLDVDSERRLTTNPMRILDSKNPALKAIIDAAPSILDHLDEESQVHFEKLQSMLEAAGVRYSVNARLVRGLDYYTRTVFEWLTDSLGAQDAVLSGGRFDLLVELLGGKPTPAVGWAMGVERLVSLASQSGLSGRNTTPQVYLVAVGDAAVQAGQVMAEQLRDALPELRLTMNCGAGNFKAQLKRADRSGATHALILGDEEVKTQTVGLKPLRNDAPQEEVAWPELASTLERRLVAN